VTRSTKVMKERRIRFQKFGLRARGRGKSRRIRPATAVGRARRGICNRLRCRANTQKAFVVNQRSLVTDRRMHYLNLGQLALNIQRRPLRTMTLHYQWEAGLCSGADCAAVSASHWGLRSGTDVGRHGSRQRNRYFIRSKWKTKSTQSETHWKKRGKASTKPSLSSIRKLQQSVHTLSRSVWWSDTCFWRHASPLRWVSRQARAAKDS